MAKVEWLPKTESEQAILQIEVAVPGFQALTGKLAIQRSQFGMNVDLEQLRKDGEALLESLLMNLRLSLEAPRRVNSPKTTDKE